MKNNKPLKITLITITSIALFFLLLALAFNIVYIKTKVSGLSMYPTLNSSGETLQDRIYINRFDDGKTNDIVVAYIADEKQWLNLKNEDYVVKRLIGKGGDKIKLVKTGEFTYEVLVNGKALYSTQTTLTVNSYYNFLQYVELNKLDPTRIEDGAVVVKPGEVFIMGDNWEASYDCASCGPISKDCIVGRVDIIVPKTQNIVWGTIKGLFKMWF